MQYLGGKRRLAPAIAGYINRRLKYRQPYWEPFCGACNVIALIDKDRERVASDLHPDLILLWQALQQGWQPPSELSREEYQRLRSAAPSALRAFAGFGCSFGAKWFGGYAFEDRKRDRGNRCYPDAARRSLLRLVSSLEGVLFKREDFFTASVPSGWFIYCDPPYVGTQGYSLGDFDSVAFWERVRLLSQANVVLVSESVAPKDFEEVGAIDFKAGLRDTNAKQVARVERVFQWAGKTQKVHDGQNYLNL